MQPISSPSLGFIRSQHQDLAAYSTLELAQALAERLALTEADWHRLKSNRHIRAQEQIAMALVFLLKDQPQETIAHLHQATGWLDRSISAPPCPDHSSRTGNPATQMP